MPEGPDSSDFVIDTFVDPICPWCMIGKRRLDRALSLSGAVAATRWHAFQLNPGMPREGMDRGEYLAAKFGGPDRARHVYDVIRREGESEGIAFAFSRIRRTPNTVAAHRLLKFAARLARADAVLDGLFSAYFLEGRDIGDPGELQAIAAAAGCDGDEAARFLVGDEDRDAVIAEDAAARAAGIGGVPFFIVGGRYQLSGAQSPEVIIRALDLVRAETARAPLSR
jgi:predicted DsbA family dithiol-disulfide isomerase